MTLELQAETDATWDDAVVESDHSGYTGSGYVNTVNSSGQWIEWIIDLDRDCNEEGIYFSGLGISDNFNEAFLNELTDTGKGAYFSIVTQTDAQKAFRDRFIALLSIAAKDVRFRMDYPAILEHDVTAAEKTSGDPAEVQTTNFSYNTFF